MHGQVTPYRWVTTKAALLKGGTMGGGLYAWCRSVSFPELPEEGLPPSGELDEEVQGSGQMKGFLGNLMISPTLQAARSLR